jgi:hypothetical protein
VTKSLKTAVVVAFIGCIGDMSTASAADSCEGAGPQTPRDISEHSGTNAASFALAPATTVMNLCNIHFHKNAEHKGPGFALFAGKGEHGGYECNDTAKLTAAELKASSKGGCHGVKPGDTIEVHWVHTSCKTTPGKGLAPCAPDTCSNPVLRVEAQAFLVVNDPKALDFKAFAYGGNIVNGLHQAKALPSDTGSPVVFRGSTTGPNYTDKACSPLKVTWSVRPSCAKVDITSLNSWCTDNPLKEDHAHGVRQLVTAKELLAPIK